jgi:exodeoxyribonuclease V alpha subunit
LTEAMNEGHCGLPTEELAPLAEKLLEVPVELVRTALGLELTEGNVVADCVGDDIAFSWPDCTEPSTLSPTD